MGWVIPYCAWPSKALPCILALTRLHVYKLLDLLGVRVMDYGQNGLTRYIISVSIDHFYKGTLFYSLKIRVLDIWLVGLHTSVLGYRDTYNKLHYNPYHIYLLAPYSL